MKKTVIQCITAVLCVIAIAVTCTNVVGKISEAQIKSAEVQAKNATIVNTNGGNGGNDVNGGVSNDPTVPSDGGTATDPTDNGTAADPSNPADNGTAAGENSGAPTSKADIIKYYNTAMNKVISSKAGYSKTRHTDLGRLEGADAIMKIEAAAKAVNSFLGVGNTDYANKKGEAKFLSQAALTEADVTSAKCDVNGTTYIITLTLADGKSVANDTTKTDASPLKRSGVYVGTDDKSAYDYKSAINIYAGLKNTKETDIKAVEEITSKTTIVVKIDSKTGNVQAFDASWHWDATLTDVKYLFVKISGIGHADTKVSIKNFQY